MRGIHFFMFLVALPAIAALGHDAYLYYINQPKPFDMAALGFIWTSYEPDSYKWVVEQTQPLGYWPYINWILAQKAVFVGVAFAGFFYILIGILRLLGVGGEKEVKNFSGNRRVDEILSNKKQGGFKYKRK
jgi:hypothetical protein